MRRALVIANPVAGGGRTRRVWRRTLHALEQVGLAPTVVFSQRPGDARRLAAAAGSGGADLVVALGGDGTANEVANGLLERRVPLPLGFVQTGSGRGLARALGLPAGIEPQVAVLAAADPQPYDLGWCAQGSIGGDRPRRAFLLAAGVGVSARVVQRSLPFKRLGNTLPYWIAGALELLQPGSAAATLRFDDVSTTRTICDLQVFNAAVGGPDLPIAPGANPQDGRLDALVVDAQNRSGLVQIARGFRTGQHVRHPGVQFRSFGALRIDAQPPLPVHLDGELTGTTPVTFEVQAGALQVLTGPIPG